MKIKNFDDADKALFEIAQHETFIVKKEAAMNEKINKIKEQFEAEVKERKESKDSLINDLMQFALLNKSEFQKQRSRNLQFGKLGFRNAPPKVTQLNRKYTVKTSIELIKKIFSGTYLRKKEELDKDRILADYSTEILSDDKLAAIGLKVDQEENFTYEINWEALEKDAA